MANEVSSVIAEARRRTHHPLGNDNVDLLWQLNVLDLALDHASDIRTRVSSTHQRRMREPNLRDNVAEAIGLDVALGLEGDSTSIDSVNLLGTRLSSEHGEDTWLQRRWESAEPVASEL